MKKHLPIFLLFFIVSLFCFQSQLDFALLGAIAARQHQITEAEAWFQKALNVQPVGFIDDCYKHEEVLFLYGHFPLDQNRLAEAESWFRRTNAYAYERGYLGYYGRALLAAKKGDKKAALDWLEKSLECYFPLAKPVLEEPLFRKIRKTKRFKVMMGRHFPKG